MKIQIQQISISFSKEEIKTFVKIIDKLDSKFCNANPPEPITKDEYKLIKTISDSLTDIIGLRL